MEVFTGMIIPEITEETNFWMIRAKKGFFTMSLLVRSLLQSDGTP